jgi:hypothetical protein
MFLLGISKWSGMEAHYLIPTPPDPLVDEKAAALYLGHPPKTLRNWRSDGKGPAFSKLEGSIRYRMSDLHAYVESRRVSFP